MSAKICVVIPVYNGQEYLTDCLNSLKEQALVPDQIILIDNGSTDGSVEFINSQFAKLALNSQIRIIVNENNNGFARACNQGIEEAMKNDADYVFILNQDTVCDKDCLRELLEAVEQDKNVFAAQALMLMWRDKNLIQTAGDRIHFLGFGHSGNYKQPVSSIQHRVSSITYASGAAMFINARALKTVGLFDEDLFMYHEDMDLCWRARLLGYKIILAPKAQVYHKYTEGIPPHRWYWSERNRSLTLLKFYKWPTLLLIFPPWLIMEVGALFYSLVTGWFTLKIKSCFAALGQLPKTLAKRSQAQKTRKISDREMSKYLEARFDFAGLEHPILKYLVNPIFGVYWRVVRVFIFW